MMRDQIQWILDTDHANIQLKFHRILEAQAKSLIVELNPPRVVLMSFDGLSYGKQNCSCFRHLRAVCNHGIPAQCLKFFPPYCEDRLSWSWYYQNLASCLGYSEHELGILVTAADVSRFGLAQESFKQFQVAALVTAGLTNALRPGVDPAREYEIDGKFLELGTINIILITNAQLSQLAMAQALITITEAKVIALQDLDIRSSYDPRNQATGTGTDNVAVIPGLGSRIDYAGGHSKLGEMIARATTSGVKQAISHL